MTGTHACACVYCVRACVRACKRACVQARARARACVRACVRPAVRRHRWHIRRTRSVSHRELGASTPPAQWMIARRRNHCMLHCRVQALRSTLCARGCIVCRVATGRVLSIAVAACCPVLHRVLVRCSALCLATTWCPASLGDAVCCAAHGVRTDARAAAADQTAHRGGAARRGIPGPGPCRPCAAALQRGRFIEVRRMHVAAKRNPFATQSNSAAPHVAT